MSDFGANVMLFLVWLVVYFFIIVVAHGVSMVTNYSVLEVIVFGLLGGAIWKDLK